jgi:predicted DNA-binding transcriptional regulator YafY
LSSIDGRLKIMANTSSRTLRLLSLLQTHRHWSGVELADRLGVSLRTLRRDVDRLRELGYPVDAQRGVEGGYQLAAGAALPPLVLDDDEAVAIVVGLLGVAHSSVAGAAESSVQALTKLTQVMPKRLRRRVDAVRAATEQSAWPTGPAPVDPETLTTLAEGCRDSERVEFGYAAADGARSDRRVEPHRLVSIGRRWYLVAYDLLRHDWRSFRLDRMARPRLAGEHFAPRRLPAEDAAAWVRDRLSQAPRSYAVTALVQAPAGAARARIGRWAEIKERDERSCVVRMNVESLDWAAFALGALDADFTVGEPAEFVEQLQTWSSRFARAVAPPGVRIRPSLDDRGEEADLVADPSLARRNRNGIGS